MTKETMADSVSHVTVLAVCLGTWPSVEDRGVAGSARLFVHCPFSEQKPDLLKGGI